MSHGFPEQNVGAHRSDDQWKGMPKVQITRQGMTKKYAALFATIIDEHSVEGLALVVRSYPMGKTYAIVSLVHHPVVTARKNWESVFSLVLYSAGMPIPIRGETTKQEILVVGNLVFETGENVNISGDAILFYEEKTGDRFIIMDVTGQFSF